ncbi:hypothetical protein VJY32_08250 [Ignavibacteria bacterium 4148-Me]|uniref:hypothetical protein n=1 Tax=Rosettibacter primus TaxID=3111523 RepID=UPI00336C0CB3
MILCKLKRNLLYTIIILLSVISCQNENTVLAPYAGSPPLSNIKIEQGKFIPRITWVGGYVAVIGVNRGNFAILDSSLVWLIYNQSGDKILYPVTFGTIIEGTQNIINNYNGIQLKELQEDNIYTYWLMKADVWNKVKDLKNKIMITDSKLPAGEIYVVKDTVKISSYSFAFITQGIDVYVNIGDLTTFGRLGKINLTSPKDDTGIKISWEITQSGVTEDKIAAIGLVEAQTYSALNIIWEVWSEEVTLGGEKIYGKKDVIPNHIYLGEKIEGTRTFVEFPKDGLKRNKNYYLWIATSLWDQKNRTRVTNYYAYATFRTW